MITQIYHKKNELFKVEYFQDEECTVLFDFTNAKNLYIQPVNGDCTPIFALSHKLSGLGIKARIFTPIWHLGWYDGISPQTPVVTLNDVLCNDELKNVNLSKYIPEDNAVLFLSEDIQTECENSFMPNEIYTYVDNNIEGKSILENVFYYGTRINELQEKITIFLPHGTQSELEKANEVSKYLWGNFGIKPNLIVLHWFYKEPRCYWYDDDIMKGLKRTPQDCFLTFCEFNRIEEALPFNKIITTNSTGILPVQDYERLQVIDGKEIFEEYLKENN